jgi:hypothetical protein
MTPFPSMTNSAKGPIWAETSVTTNRFPLGTTGNLAMHVVRKTRNLEMLAIC